MRDQSLISVVLPCYNAERFVAQALDSLLAQTHRSLEILAIDDGSTDASASVLERYAAHDKRIRVIRHATNRGLIATLNHGVDKARGAFVARMDADDTAAPQRIERQLTLLRRLPDVGVVGTGVRFTDEGGRPITRQAPLRSLWPAGARFLGLFATPIAHVTLLAHNEVMREYPYGVGSDSLHTEDYELFSRMLAAGIGFANVDERLVAVRVSDASISRRHEQIQIENFVTCARRHLERTLQLKIPPGPHRVLVNRMNADTTAADLGEGLRYLAQIEAEILARGCQSEEVRGIADEQAVDILAQAALKGSVGVRLAAARLAVVQRRRVLSPRGRRYLAVKRRRLLPGF